MHFTAPTNDTLFAHPARVLSPTLEVERMLRLVEEKVFDPQVLEEGRELFFWPAEISSDRLDAYFTRMATSSLRNYAADAEAGVSFQNSHRWMELGFGQSLSGEYREDGAGGRVLAWFYTLSGLNLNGVNTSDLITGIRAGLIKDVSIGFYGGRFRCALCGRDLWDWDCPHVPGLHYEVKGEEEVQAFAWVEDARLAEVSAVYDGATPGAAILKGEREAEAGRLNDKARRLLEQRYRIHLPTPRQTWQLAGRSGARPGQERDELTPEAAGRIWQRLAAAHPDLSQHPPSLTEESMNIRNQVLWQEAEGERVSGSLAADLMETLLQAHEAESDAQAELQAQAVRLSDLNARNAQLAADREALEARIVELEDLEPLAEMGRQYRTDLVAEALAEGVRALGNGFAEEVYRPLLENQPLATIKRLRDDWKAQGDALFTGGRKIREAAEPPATAERGPDVAAYTGA